jgi:hypothetical protein
MRSNASSELPLTAKEIAFLRFWDGLRGDRPMPERAQIVPEDLKPWIGWLHLVEVLDDGEDFLYRIFGSEAGGATGNRLHLKRVSEWDETVRDRALRTYRKAAVDGRPLYYCAFEDFSPEFRSTFSRIVVPFGPSPSAPGLSTHILSFVTKHSRQLPEDCAVIDPIMTSHP